jgi:hypothetical protein
MLCLRFSDIGISLGLEECRASFEASLREAPPDEVFISMSSTTCLMTRSGPARPGRVSMHALPSAVRFLLSAQPILRARDRAFTELSPHCCTLVALLNP